MEKDRAFETMNTLLRGEVYARGASKRALFMEAMRETCRNHYAHCVPYRKLCDKRHVDPSSVENVWDVPYLPTGIFKDTLLRSVPEEAVFREINSSATSSGRPSRIALDKANSMRWSLSMQRMLVDRIGNERLDTMVLDDESALGRGGVVSARASMTRSLLFSSRNVSMCLKAKGDLLELDKDALAAFLSGAGNGQGHMLFGFTFILYMYVVKPLLEAGERFDMPDLKILHAGGWKKLEAMKVSGEQLMADCVACFGVRPENVVDIYGFSEQGGMLYPSCECGVRHVPAWGEVLCRNPMTLEVQSPGEPGLMQFLTPIQTSYPGHSVLTEDVGYIVGVDDCPCGRGGTTFRITGRSDAATEERGCGDIMADLFA